jgi:hypothetical protein
VDESHEPLVCDASRSDEIAFVFHRSDAYEASPYLPHGYALLLVDGSCRYFVYGGLAAPGGVLRTGELTPDEVDALNDDILTAPWRALGGRELNYGAGADAWELTLSRGEHRARCYSSCTGDDTLTALTASSLSRIAPLWERGTPLSGPVDVVRSAEPTLREPIVWAGEADLVAGLGPGISTLRIDDPEDAALLRDLRATHALSGGTGPPLTLQVARVVVSIGVADVLPFDLQLHSVRGERPW